ncbi:HNH endonuclease [Embleya sp. NPDC056575]|uniref:HNH endonuclease n=1 Tax=unclassified Embleya TaxID=2699296 RepID=UPI0036894507
MTSTLLDQLRTMRTHHMGDTPTRHKPIAILWAIGREPTPEDRLIPWPVFRDGVRPLLKRFGRTPNQITPEYPFWYLAGEFWQVTGRTADNRRFPGIRVLEATGAVAGFTRPAVAELADRARRAEVVAHLLDTWFPDVDHEQLLTAVGIGEGDDPPPPDGVPNPTPDPTDDTPPARIVRTTSGYDRDSRVVQMLKAMYDDECQICSTTVRGRAGTRSSDGAHVRPLGEGGPDNLTNLLCLCPNHHRRLDRQGIHIGAGGVVYVTDTFEVEGTLTFRSDHRLNPAHIRHHRIACGVAPDPDEQPPAATGD